MHAVVGDRNELEIKVLHSVDFELERESWFQVTVDAILTELKATRTVRDI